MGKRRNEFSGLREIPVILLPVLKFFGKKPTDATWAKDSIITFTVI